jgi:hypothetical protein
MRVAAQPFEPGRGRAAAARTRRVSKPAVVAKACKAWAPSRPLATKGRNRRFVLEAHA